MKSNEEIRLVNPKRIRKMNKPEYVSGPVVYWMSRDQRAGDNWAMLTCQEKALEYRVPMVVVFCLVSEFLGAMRRQFLFMIEGLEKVDRRLEKLNIPFFLLRGRPEEQIPRFLSQIQAGMLITDFDPLKIKRSWKEGVERKIQIPLFEVDAHNVVPCWVASEKQEWAAYTIRPKIHRRLFEFLEPFPEIQPHPFSLKKEIHSTSDWRAVIEDVKGKEMRDQRAHYKSGEDEASRILERFIGEKLDHYSGDRNDPTKDGLSGLSPYLHFGQISAQKIACVIDNGDAERVSKEAFLEELIVRRELSDNYCYYNKDYDTPNGFPGWAKKTLAEHQSDGREHVYSLEQFENAETHERLWNACQMEMVKKGKMHGYMRMYWAKKILEWSPTAGAAMEIAIALNDRYEFDGRDPNGYTGIAWAIGGVHDRAWFQRPIFGKIRYMSENGCRSKFDVDRYIQNMTES